jgi:hypothetical protein
MLPKRRLPKLKKKKEDEEKLEEDKEEQVNYLQPGSEVNYDYNNNYKQPDNEIAQGGIEGSNNLVVGDNNPIQHQNERHGSHLPEFLRSIDNEQLLQTYQRMRDRNFLDGAVQLNVEPDDIANDNLELYDNKGINVEPPLLNENLACEKEYYVQSVSKGKYYRIPKEGVDKLQRKVKKKSEPVKKELITEKRVLDIQKETEDEIFNKFDRQLKIVINDLSNKITLIFLVAGGFLAGKALLTQVHLY